MRRVRKGVKAPDFILLLTVTALVGLGVIMVFSSSNYKTHVLYGDAFYYLKRQVLWAALGYMAMLAMSRFDYWRLKPLAKPAFLATLALLVLVLIPGVGRVAHGARRWIGIGNQAFQPSELSKVVMVVYFSAWLAAAPSRLKHFSRGILPYLILVGVVCALILAEPDLGTAVAIGGSAMLLLFSAGASLGHLLAIGAAAAPALALAIFGEEYRRRRFLAFLNPWADPLGAGFHIIQALYALGSGGVFGLGLGQSRQKFFYLPEQHTDFIFAIIGEELGFVGAITVLAAYLLLIWRGYRTAMAAPDLFGCLLAAGITSVIAVQALINIGVVTGTLPITGIPLPFLSFGGSSLIFTMAGMGILLNVSRHTR